MNIAFDARYIEKEGSGVSVYASHLLKHLADEPQMTITPIALKEQISLLPESIRDKAIIAPYPLQKHPHQDIWISFALPGILKSHKIDLLFCPAFVIPLKKVPCKISVMIHDLAFLYAKESMTKLFSFYARFLTYKAVQKADVILTGTRTVKKEIQKSYSVDENKVIAVHHGLNLNHLDKICHKELQNIFLQEKGIHSPFMLFVGNLEPRKDIARMISFFHNLRQDSAMKDFQLVICGKKRWKWAETEKKIENLHNIVFTGYVEQRDLEYLYKNCEAVLATSLYEGFGFPVLEGMQYGKVVLASDIPSFREIGGDGALYIDLSAPQICAKKVAELLGNSDKRKALTASAGKRIQNFSWKRCAETTAEAFRKTLTK